MQDDMPPERQHGRRAIWGNDRVRIGEIIIHRIVAPQFPVSYGVRRDRRIEKEEPRAIWQGRFDDCLAICFAMRDRDRFVTLTAPGHVGRAVSVASSPRKVRR